MDPRADACKSSEAGMDELFKSDQFRMECMKVLPCTKHFVHDWTECPYAHPHEKARRRDPRRYTYTGIACPSMRQDGSCTLADNCPYSHNVFEYWLHPTRHARRHAAPRQALYRTQLCNDGTTCTRKLCFFAHNLDELRTPDTKPFVPAEAVLAAAAAAAAASGPATMFDAPPPAAHSPLQSPRQSFDAAAQQAQAQQQAQAAQLTSPQGQEHPLVEVMTRLVARGKVTPEKSAAILQQVLSPGALQDLRGVAMAERVCLSDPGWARADLSPRAATAAAAAAPAAQPGVPGVRYSADCAAPRCAAPEHGPSVAEQRLALLQGVLHEAQARAALGLPATAADALLAPAGPHGLDRMASGSARSSIDTVRASFDAAPPRTSFDSPHLAALGPASRHSWDTSYTTRVQQQLLLDALHQQQQLQQQQAAALAAAAGSSFWAAGGDSRSLDSQRSAAHSARHSMESRPSVDSAPPHLHQLQELHHASQGLARMSLDEPAPRMDVFSSGFYAPAPTELLASSQPLNASERAQLMHPQPRRSA
ncbi:hypothetical protein CHLNCDRAFT_138869 [Chlorella variabilis]|uniref:C3H1-type domain-containing protein n=1 Tax=Chlorella variabilis TaxID=554065 RepID=E1ZP84_CHLVA|nr:hypothetical protein CHLNCDRAFT_138869 [Chlorella variabilis]EFN52401.1 hypothetical protein CHLNCDRAFT_138869 [Chlorella variabilis]|eukprot:XP_005844503.1 hypothetical protein CHLNCDRAFT_138869 [Chlorella variabilis]